jgi:deoxyinosine 3'endonuclease (endonuclease V)
LKEKLVLRDQLDWNISDDPSTLHFVGGVDISFVKDNNEDACASLVVLSYPELKVSSQDLNSFHLS